jgi:hypothetical protein
MIQTSCSELLVDTNIHDHAVAYEQFTKMAELFKWEFSPPLSKEILRDIIKDSKNDSREIQLAVYDEDGNSAAIRYGNNGYLDTGFRFDSECNDWDIKCYPIFKVAIEQLNGNLIACDGGTE